MEEFTVRECSDLAAVRELFLEYSHIKGAESCFVSFEKEVNNLDAFYAGGALLVGYENETPAGCIAIKKLDEDSCEAKRLFIRPEYRGKGYARILLDSMLAKARELGFKKVTFTTKPAVMQIAYGLYKRMGFDELTEDPSTVRMSMDL